MGRKHTASHTFGKLDASNTPSAQVEAPEAASVEVEAKALNITSIEAKVEGQAPEATSAAVQVRGGFCWCDCKAKDSKMKAPKIPSTKVEVEVKAPKQPSAECEVQASRMPSMECQGECEATVGVDQSQSDHTVEPMMGQMSVPESMLRTASPPHAGGSNDDEESRGSDDAHNRPIIYNETVQVDWENDDEESRGSDDAHNRPTVYNETVQVDWENDDKESTYAQSHKASKQVLPAVERDNSFIYTTSNISAGNRYPVFTTSDVSGTTTSAQHLHQSQSWKCREEQATASSTTNSTKAVHHRGKHTASHTFGKLDASNTSSAQVEAPEAASVEVEAKALNITSIEAEVEGQAPEATSAAVQVRGGFCWCDCKAKDSKMKAPKIPSTKVEVEVKAPKQPSAECEVQASRMPSMECEGDCEATVGVDAEVTAPNASGVGCELQIEVDARRARLGPPA